MATAHELRDRLKRTPVGRVARALRRGPLAGPAVLAGASRTDCERAVEEAYRMILGRDPEFEARAAAVDRLEAREFTVEELCLQLTRSPEFAARFERRWGHQPSRGNGAGSAPAPPAPSDSQAEPGPGGEARVDVRELIEKLSVEELAAAADDYYQKNISNPDYYFAKPLTNVDEAPDFLICFAEILAGLRPVPGMVVLDFGAGTCWTSRWLTQLGYEVIASDVSETALDVGRQLFERMPVAGDRPRPRFLHFDGRRIDLPDASVDRIFCFDSFHHVPNPEEVLAEMARVLRDGGIAGFSEPGPHHSKTAQSQFEMKNYTVIENDILMDDIWRWARACGFTRLDLALFSAQPFRVSLTDYQDFLAGGATATAYGDHVRDFANGRRNFFLTKGQPARPDSRDRQGLAGEIEVTVATDRLDEGGTLAGTCRVVNTGTNTWLTSGLELGLVQVGVHLYDADGRLVDRDWARVPLAGVRAVEPGQAVEAPFALAAPPPGRFRVEFDLVSEQVCWFEINGCRPAGVEVTVS